ncbi:MAG: flippase-like domain-containing protein [Bacteroidales bacterium]|nr:flippase-like domain-containing protein [Candidatus Latescibacterota bacterium]
MQMRKIYRWLLFAAVMAAVIWFAWKSLSRLDARELLSRKGPVLLSLALVTSAFLTRFAVWSFLASTLGLRAGITEGGRGYFLSLLGRYVPGKIGLALVRIETYRKHPPEKVVLATGLELLCAVSAALLLALAGSVDPPVPLPSLYRWASMAGILILAVILSPPVLTRAASLLMRVTGRKTSAKLPSYRLIMAFTGLYVIPGLLHGLGLFVLLDSMSGVGAGSYLAITGAYYAASLGGLIAIFAPGGLGVREGLLFLILPLIVPSEDAVLAALLIRLVTLASELTLAGLFSILYKKKHRQENKRRSPDSPVDDSDR